MILTEFECNIDFEKEMTDTENNPNDLYFKKIKCPICQNFHYNLKSLDFSNKKEDFIDLLMLDNDLENLENIFQCRIKNQYFQLDIEASTNKQAIIHKLKINK